MGQEATKSISTIHSSELEAFLPETTDPKTKKLDEWNKEEIFYFLKYIPLETEKKTLNAFQLYHKKFRECNSGSDFKKLVNGEEFYKIISEPEHRYTIQFFLKILVLDGEIMSTEKFTIMAKLVSTDKKFSQPLISKFASALRKTKDDDSFLDLCAEMADKLNDRTKYFTLYDMFVVEAEQPNPFLAKQAAEKKEEELLNSDKCFGVKLILTQTNHTSNVLESLLKKTVHKIAGGILRNKLYTPFASFHALLLVGPYVMEFNDSGLVFPRKFNRSSAIFMLDVLPAISYTSETKQEQLTKIQDSLFEAAHHYNTKVTYRMSPGNSPALGSCQKFVDYAISRIVHNFQIDPKENRLNDNGCIKKYITYLRNELNPKCILYLSDEFKSQIKSAFKDKPLQSEIIFETHEELDLFVHQVNTILDVDFMEAFPAEYYLCKGFDRVFWTQFLFSKAEDFAKSEKEEASQILNRLKEFRTKCQPISLQFSDGKDLSSNFESELAKDKQPFTCLCPFNNPVDTSTIILKKK